jgi:hypothetical protein
MMIKMKDNMMDKMFKTFCKKKAPLKEHLAVPVLPMLLSLQTTVTSFAADQKGSMEDPCG